MITILLLILIYFAFISLGLPDSLFGVSWPQMRIDWALPLDYAGFVSVFIVIATVVSSLLSGVIIKKLGTGKVTFFSCLMTGLSILGISFVPSYLWLVVLSVTLGFGAGSVDTALNNYVALHFKAHHMNWLHSFWGVGATVGPLFISNAFAHELSWRVGYRQVGSVQLFLAFLLFISLPLWRMHARKTSVSNSENPDNEDEVRASDEIRPLKPFQMLSIRGVPFALLTFVFYCAAEVSAGLWGSSYLVGVRGLPVEKAALFVSMYYSGIMAGRFLSGFVSLRVSSVTMIRAGVLISAAAGALIALPLPSGMVIAPLFLFGLGMAPIFPSMIHETPARFGKQNSQYIIGFQMASAYAGCAVFPPLFGILLKNVSMGLYPFMLAGCMLLTAFCSEAVKRLAGKTKA